jgi:glycosyltransferase involved in cell wall biosynthesis
MKYVIVNLIQDVATPHNNVLIEQFKDREDVKVNLWYARDMDKRLYQWNQNISDEHFPAIIYGTHLNLSFIKYCIFNTSERYVIVGWANINTQLIQLLFFLLGRRFNHWTDLPDPKSSALTLRKKFIRWLAYKLLKFSNSKVFGVGKTTLSCFKSWGFPDRKIVNLPIFVKVDDDLPQYYARRDELYSKYMVIDGDFLISAGSRLVYDKGYDLLVRAVAALRLDVREKIKLVIVGSGDQLSELERLVLELDVSKQVIFEKWLEIDDFKALIANSEVFVHPARFDSYGGTTLGMALGVPVIGSISAGAAGDRIEHGVNGFLYEAENVEALADALLTLYSHPKLRQQMGRAARKTALEWHPSRGVEILLENSI